MYVGIPRVHRWLYLVGAGLIAAGLVLLGVAVSDGGLVGTEGITAVALLVAGLAAVWAGLRVRSAVESMQQSLARGLSGSPAASGEGIDLREVMETFASAGLTLDPKLFEHADVTTHVQTINVQETSAEEAAMRQRGLPATATVDSFQTLMQLGDRAVATAALQVTLDGEPYPVTVNGFVPQAVASRITPGTRVPVLVDPDVHERVLVDWDRV